MPGFATFPLCPISVCGSHTLVASVTPVVTPLMVTPPYTPSPPSLTFFPKVHIYISDLLQKLFNSETNLPGCSTGSSNPVLLPLKWSSSMSSLLTLLSDPGEKPPPPETGTCLPQTEVSVLPAASPLGLNTTTALVLGHPYQWACSSLH